MENEISFLRATEANIKDILHLLDELLAVHTSLDDTIRLREDYIERYKKSILIELADKGTNYFILAYDEGLPVGFGVGKKVMSPQMFRDGLVGYLPYIYVKSEYRNKGLGKRIVHIIEKWFADNNIKTMEVNVLESNSKAADFYIKDGYKVISKRLRKQIGE